VEVSQKKGGGGVEYGQIVGEFCCRRKAKDHAEMNSYICQRQRYENKETCIAREGYQVVTRNSPNGHVQSHIDHHSNSLSISALLRAYSDSPVTFGEEVILSIDVDHPILEHRLPLVLYTLNL
jgi:hypothetical protein